MNVINLISHSSNGGHCVTIDENSSEYFFIILLNSSDEENDSDELMDISKDPLLCFGLNKNSIQLPITSYDFVARDWSINWTTVCSGLSNRNGKTVTKTDFDLKSSDSYMLGLILVDINSLLSTGSLSAIYITSDESLSPRMMNESTHLSVKFIAYSVNCDMISLSPRNNSL